MATQKKVLKSTDSKKTTFKRVIIKDSFPIRSVLEIATAKNVLAFDPAEFETRNNFIDETNDDQVSLDVKKIILAIIGSNSKPESVNDDDSLEDTLGFDQNLINFLNIALTHYVDHKKQGSRISPQEMDGCKIVGDCITLVKSKI